jgi:predicted metal-dependent phosphoesterase TrpH
MRIEDRMFDIRPKIVRTGQPAAITVRPRYRKWHGPFRVTATGMEGRGGSAPVILEGVRGGTGGITFDLPFPAEQEYLVRIEETGAGDPVFVGEVRLYALDDDLLPFLPWKGDVHMHSTRSDGREEPGYVAAACRRIGLDFMALTDHRLYEPSREAIRAFDGCPTNLLMMPGEEVHPPGTGAHLLNVGGSESVNAMLGSPAYREGVARIAAAAIDVPAEHRAAYAACAWCLGRIRDLGGIAILPHPYWETHDAYNVPEPLLAALFDHQPFDAYEVLGGYASQYREANSLQVARYHEETARGRHIPAMGNSDAHGCERGELFGWYYSIVFAERNERGSLAGAIRGLRSVAVEQSPGEFPRIYGPFRLVRFAHYLLREVFPLHDVLAAEEGSLMLRWLDGDRGAAEALAALAGRTARLYRSLCPIP